MINQENEALYTAVEPVFDPQKVQFDNEKREFRKTCNNIGLMIILASVIFLSFSLMIVISYTVFENQRNLPSFLDSVPDNIIGGLANVAAIGICGFSFIKFTKTDLSTALPFNKMSVKKLFSVIAIGFTVCMLSNMMTSLYLEITASLGLDLNIDIEVPDSDSFIEILVYFLSTAIVPAFSEEILFRGAVLSPLRKYGDTSAIFVSSALFGLFHANFVQIPFAFIVGLILAWSVVYTNSLLPAIIIHAANNGFSVLCDILYTNAANLNINESIIDLFTVVTVAGVAIPALISVIILSKSDKKFMKPTVYNGILDRKTKTKMLVTSPTIIISTVILLVETVTSHLSI